jgi:hypothetical protein
MPEHMIRVASTGLQDIERLNTPRGQPSLKYYRAVLRQRTRWASQFVRVEFDNEANFGTRAVVTLPVKAELITRAVLRIELPDFITPQLYAFDLSGARAPKWNWTNSLGNAICSNVQMLINNEVIDEMDSRLLEVLDEQTGYVDHFDSTNALTYRDPYGYNETVDIGTPFGPSVSLPTPPLNALHIQFPFWWNRGIGPQALPIQALQKDKVQIACTFRPIQECVYTESYTSTNSNLPGPGPIPTFLGCPYLDASGGIIPGLSIPTSLSFRAYWLIEYVSLEDREAAAFRMADLQIPIEQHVALQPQTTNGAPIQRIPLYPGGLIRDMMWVCQRVEAPTYNAWFLFSRNLWPGDVSGGKIWWPDADIPPFNYWDGYARPAFVDRRSDPITAATMTIRGLTRFEHEAPSFFRSLIPALNCRRTPLVDRYIYRYDFGFWPTGGLAEANELKPDEMRGAANWSKLPRRELVLNMWQEGCGNTTWIPNISQQRTYTGPNFSMIEADFAPTTAAFHVRLTGARPTSVSPPNQNGRGGFVEGIFDYQQIRRLAGYQSITIRCVPNGSAALLITTASGPTTTYTPLAVAGSGGYGSVSFIRPEDFRGGNAEGAIACSFNGGNTARTHIATGIEKGGGGGGRVGALPAIVPGPGNPDGDSMEAHATDAVFMATLQSTGGTTHARHGGDGYYGGGSGTEAGGGGGSYISSYMTSVETGSLATITPSRIVVTPLIAQSVQQPNFNVYVWLTRINMLRITNGHGALMFAP